MPASVKKILCSAFFTLFALLLSSSLVLGSTIEEEASYFARSGESATAVAAGGYYIVLVNGLETAVLKQSSEEFVPVENDAEITTAVNAYAQAVFQNELKPKIPQITTAFAEVRTPIDNCIIGSKWFSFNLTRGGVYVKYNVRYDPVHWPKEHGAIHYIEDNIGKFEEAWNKATQGLDNLE